jgi:hypothetical protein
MVWYIAKRIMDKWNKLQKTTWYHQHGNTKEIHNIQEYTVRPGDWVIKPYIKE